MASSDETATLIGTPPSLRSDERLAAGVLALVAASSLLVARIALNARVVSGVAASMETIVFAATLGPALAAVAIAVITEDIVERIGLAFVGAFALLLTITPAVTVPAVVAVTGGGTLAIGRRWQRLERGNDWHVLPVALVLAAVAVSLFGSIGVAPSALWTIGSHLTLLGAAATPALLGHGRSDWAFGGVVAGVLVAIGMSAPFVTGAITLIGGGVVGASLLVLAVGLCGIVTTASAALRQRHWYALVGAGLLLAGGIPITVPRALAVVLGLLLLIEPRDGGASA
jgi:hypothetical protein